jgi:hypothetical protein
MFFRPIQLYFWEAKLENCAFPCGTRTTNESKVSGPSGVGGGGVVFPPREAQSKGRQSGRQNKENLKLIFYALSQSILRKSAYSSNLSVCVKKLESGWTAFREISYLKSLWKNDEQFHILW